VGSVEDALARIERILRARTSTRRFLSRREAARALGVRRERVAQWIAAGRLREVDLDGDMRIPMSEIERLELHGLPPVDARPRRRRKATATSNMTAAEVAAELERY
jgi:excisionase family DNA binding protein